MIASERAAERIKRESWRGLYLIPAVLALLLFGCADVWRRIPPRETYEYRDNLGQRYHVHLENGSVDGQTNRIGEAGDTVEILVWTARTRKHRTIPWKTERYLHQDTLYLSESARKRNVGCPTPDGQLARGIEEYIRIRDSHSRSYLSLYRRYLKTHRFGGEIQFRIVVDPAGSIESIYLLRNTSGDHDFAVSLLELVNAWKFRPIDSNCYDEFGMSLWFKP